MLTNSDHSTPAGSRFPDNAQCNTGGGEKTKDEGGNSEQRNIAGATLSLSPGRQLTVLGTHLVTTCAHYGKPSNDRVRNAQFDELFAKGDAHLAAGSAVILAGDFNTAEVPKRPKLQGSRCLLDGDISLQ